MLRAPTTLSVESSGRRTARRAPSAPRPGRGVRSEVVAGVSDLQDSSNVLLKVRLRFWLALQLLDYLLALIRRRGEESTQHGLCRRRCGQCCASWRRLRIDRRHHLRVTARGVDDRTQIGVCGRDAGPRGQRQCQSANCGKQSGQRQRAHLWKTFQPTQRPTRKGDDISVAKFESATTPHPCPLAAGGQRWPDGPSARVYRATQDRARQVLLNAQRKRWGEPPFATLGSRIMSKQAWKAKKPKPCGPKDSTPTSRVVAAIDLVRWELSLGIKPPHPPDGSPSVSNPSLVRRQLLNVWL